MYYTYNAEGETRAVPCTQKSKYKLHFETREQAKEAYKAAYDKNAEKAHALLDDKYDRIAELLRNDSVDLDYFIDGDTHGIYDECMYLSVNIENIECKKKFHSI